VQVALLAKTESGTPGYTHCRWVMQVKFAAERCIGNLSSTKEQRELQKESSPNSPACERGQLIGDKKIPKAASHGAETTPPRRGV
jgi:hypothetical protein